MIRGAVRRRLGVGDEGTDEGTILILTMFFCALALVVVLVVTAATSLYLERKRLFTMADGAALAGAESFELAEMTLAGDQLRPVLKPDEVRAAVQEYLDAAPHPDMEGLSVAEATSSDGVSATVTLHAYWRPPMVAWVLPEGVPLDVTVVARSVFW